MDKLQAMNVFTKIAEKGSLTAAANSLGKSLPAVVRILSALEEELQIRLLNRTTRRIALTQEGQVYLERSRKILAEIEETERLLSNQQVEPTGAISVTAPVRFGEMHIAPAVNRFLQEYPRMQVNLLLLDRIVNMLDEGIDVAVRIAALHDSSLVAKPISEVRQVCCVRPDLLEKYHEPRQPQDLAELPCVRFTGISASSIWHFAHAGKKLSVKVHGGLSCNHVAAAVQACMAGLGFGQFYSYQVMPYVRQGKLKLVLSDYEDVAQPVSLVYQHRQLLSSKIRLFVDWLAQDLQTTLAEAGH